MTVEEANLLVAQAERLLKEALAQRRTVFQEAVQSGLSTAEISKTTGICRQRIYKILDGNRPAKPREKKLKVVPEIDFGSWDGRL